MINSDNLNQNLFRLLLENLLYIFEVKNRFFGQKLVKFAVCTGNCESVYTLLSLKYVEILLFRQQRLLFNFPCCVFLFFFEAERKRRRRKGNNATELLPQITKAPLELSSGDVYSSQWHKNDCSRAKVLVIWMSHVASLLCSTIQQTAATVYLFSKCQCVMRKMKQRNPKHAYIVSNFFRCVVDVCHARGVHHASKLYCTETAGLNCSAAVWVQQQGSSFEAALRLLSDCRWCGFLLSSVDLLHAFLILFPIGLLISHLPVSCHVAVSGIRVQFLRLNFLTFQYIEYSS